MIPYADFINHENVDTSYSNTPPETKDESLEKNPDESSGCDTDNDSDYLYFIKILYYKTEILR